MNSLPSQLTDGLLLQYADDTTVICSGVDPSAVRTIMCSQLSLIQHWVLQSKMRINFKKSSVMWFRASSCSAGILYPPISIDGVELTVTTKQKYLGLIFDYSLSWAHHVAGVCSKMSYLLYKDEKPSVRPSVGTFFRPSVSPWFLPGSTPDMLDMKRPSLQIAKNVFKRF